LTILTTPTLRFAVLGSGSDGNAIVIESHSNTQVVRLLLDCGFSVKELDKRLELLGLSAEQLTAVLITHEHQDHATGAYRVAKRWRLPLYATYGTLVGAYGDKQAQKNEPSKDWRNFPYLNIVVPDQPFSIGNIQLTPITVPHDASEPVQYRFESHGRHLAIVTDLGHASAHLKQALNGLHALVLECNHDNTLLEQSKYPASVKQRIGGDWGHLSNQQSAELLASLDNKQLHSLWCAHLSQNNNTADLAQMALAQAIGWEVSKINVLNPETLNRWFTV
jgi:phosphoribosyl 1,2-cyclic phosphodiesterase